MLGNNDYNVDYGPGVHESATQIIDGVRLFVSHYPRDAERAAESGEYDLAIHGHTHVPRDEVVVAVASSTQAAPSGRAVAPNVVLALVELEDGGSVSRV